MGYLLKLFLPIWAGSLWWMIMVAKVLFDKIPTAFLAGIVAGQLFHYLSYFSLGMSVLIFFIYLNIMDGLQQNLANFGSFYLLL